MFTSGTFAAHYEASLPIFLDPAKNNPFLTKKTRETITTHGLNTQFYPFLPDSEYIPDPFYIKGYLCPSPTKDKKPILESFETNSFFYLNPNGVSFMTIKLFPGSINGIPNLIGSNLVVSSNYPIPFVTTNWIAVCHTDNDWNTEVTSSDTIDLRIQYPVGTPIKVGDFSTKIHSNFASHTTTENNFIHLGNGTTNSIMPTHAPIKSAVAEMLDGRTVDLTEVFQAKPNPEDLHDPTKDPEAFLIPIDTAVIHFTIK